MTTTTMVIKDTLVEETPATESLTGKKRRKIHLRNGFDAGGSSHGTNKKRIAAFFDYDKTLIAKDSLALEACHVMMEQYFFSWKNLPRSWNLFLTMIMGPLVARNYVSPERITHTYVSSYRGFSMQFLQEMGQTLYDDEIHASVYPEMLQVMEHHRSQGHMIVLISASPEHLLRPYAEHSQVKADIWTSTVLESNDDGMCLGHPVGNLCFREEKVCAMEQMANDYNIDLSASFAYSDHHSDLPLLQAVGTPTVVNPTPILEEIAMAKQWSILRPKCPAMQPETAETECSSVESKGG